MQYHKGISKQLINSEIFNDNEVIQNLFELYLEYSYGGPMVYNVKYRTNQSIRDLSDHLSKYFNSFLRVDLPRISGYLSSHPKIFSSHCMIELEEEIDYDDFTIDISEVKEGMSNIALLGKILSVQNIHEFVRKDQSVGKVCSFLFGDPTGVVKIVLWDERVDIVNQKS